MKNIIRQFFGMKEKADKGEYSEPYSMTTDLATLILGCIAQSCKTEKSWESKQHDMINEYYDKMTQKRLEKELNSI